MYSFAMGRTFGLTFRANSITLIEASPVVHGVTRVTQSGTNFERKNNGWLITQAANVTLSSTALKNKSINYQYKNDKLYNITKHSRVM